MLAVELPVILLENIVSNRMTGSTTANIQKTNKDLLQNDRQFNGQHTKEKQ
jgi:hypothetical protein